MRGTKTALVLKDHRIGNVNQALSLAQQLMIKYKTINIQYNCLSILPNCILSIYPIHINKSDFVELLNNNSLSKAPDFIISSGRRLAPLALYLKKFFLNQPKIIQIMRPQIALHKFDIVILPSHDNPPQNKPNIITINSALNNVTNRIKQSNEPISLFQKYPIITNEKFVGVIIGGDTKNHQMSQKYADEFLQILSALHDKNKMPFFFSFSRRTPKFFKELIIKKFNDGTHIIYDPTIINDNAYNPYLGILYNAYCLILTADSISMCSEAVSTGKSTYIHCPQYLPLKKHKVFVERLINLGAAKYLDCNTDLSTIYHYEPLNEVEKVVDIIKNKINI
ncbi:MAG: ELM1/GtrOC1 family putative glycosyltransferase [Rickettsiaceae bacterium]